MDLLCIVIFRDCNQAKLVLYSQTQLNLLKNRSVSDQLYLLAWKYYSISFIVMLVKCDDSHFTCMSSLTDNQNSCHIPCFYKMKLHAFEHLQHYIEVAPYLDLSFSLTSLYNSVCTYVFRRSFLLRVHTRSILCLQEWPCMSSTRRYMDFYLDHTTTKQWKMQ